MDLLNKFKAWLTGADKPIVLEAPIVYDISNHSRIRLDRSRNRRGLKRSRKTKQGKSL